jgi:ABC-type transport system substrate-binding protein
VIQNDTCSQVLIFIKRDHPDTPPEMNDVRVRQALLYAIDRESIVKALYKIGEVPAIALPKEMPGFDSNLTPLPYDPDRARALLREANATNMKPFTVTLKDVDVLAPNVQQLAQAIMGYWKAIGLDASAKAVDQPTFVGGAQSQKLSLFLAGVPPVFDIGEFGAGYLAPGAVNTPANDDPKLIAMFDQIDRTTDTAERAKLAGPFTRYMNDMQYLLAVLQIPAFFATGPKVEQWSMRRGNGYAGPWWGIRAR